MRNYNIRVKHDDGTVDWVAKIYFNGKCETTIDRDDAMAFSSLSAAAWSKGIEVEGVKFEMVEVGKETVYRP